MSDPASTVLFRRIRRPLRRRWLRELAREFQRQVAGGRPFTCLLAGDAELRRLNRLYLGRDYPADVLSFPPAGTPVAGLGDIAISVGRAGAQARRHGHCVEDEIGILMLHGLLHLLGFDHQTDRGRMARAEIRWRRKLGLPAGLRERT
jgi:probable rRNA maturation factor